MTRNIKSKIALGSGTLFGLLLAITIVAFVFIHLLSAQTETLLTANYQTIRYCNEMMHIMDKTSFNGQDLREFEQSLAAQELNITEKGEAAATRKLRLCYELFKKSPAAPGIRDTINAQLYTISGLNQHALEQRNIQALSTSGRAKLWIAVLSALVVITGFTLTVNFPGYIANPIRLLTDAMNEISQKNYHKRIHIDSRDEFGQMANAFNSMAHKLNEFENSSMSRLMFEKKRVETVINQMQDAVLGLDANGKILFINHTAENLFNLRSDAIVGKSAADVALHNDLLRTVLRKDQPGPLKIIADGGERFFSVSARLVDNDNVQIGEVFTLSDITSFKELDISKTNLLATISHELKTPISSIKMSARLMMDARVGALNPEQQELLHNINGDTERLLRLTGELLNMTQIETGNIQLKLSRASMEQIANEALATVSMQLQERNIQIQTDYPQEPVFAFADADKTTWVLINLLTNAIKYTPDNGQITLSVRQNVNTVLCKVEDNGPGIAAPDLQHVFDRYYKVRQKNTGSGLGLSIAKEFIEAQGGRIKAESEPGKGSIFSFTLPVHIG